MAMRGIFEFPKGLIYEEDFLSFEEEQALLAFIEEVDFLPVVMHGQAAKRTVAHFGYNYDYESGKLVSKGTPFPPILVELRKKCAAMADIDPETIIMCLISKYPPESTIGWHRDRLIFGSHIVGVSLGSSCFMRFQRTVDQQRKVFEQELNPRSAYILTSHARYYWQHSIPPTKGLRYSITFRTLKK